ncbi:hypothetical protein FIV42_14450 [Persicimonas caeni]|uniref:Uncharacterized protein n=1 Tax=Persicimonas caeni TaxID=2292766 RepID=A0A4Y6PV76_PERCE|nr:hypothetical protein [Persicimonas caeni]QDG51897.1 hypothetical protein FIV42_14450 [Persicimonas caeni]QED33118.1 hypothetical protein FRD00_14445 [Persicimonas caeni]
MREPTTLFHFIHSKNVQYSVIWQSAEDANSHAAQFIDDFLGGEVPGRFEWNRMLGSTSVCELEFGEFDLAREFSLRLDKKSQLILRGLSLDLEIRDIFHAIAAASSPATSALTNSLDFPGQKCRGTYFGLPGLDCDGDIAADGIDRALGKIKRTALQRGSWTGLTRRIRRIQPFIGPATFRDVACIVAPSIGVVIDVRVRSAI